MGREVQRRDGREGRCLGYTRAGAGAVTEKGEGGITGIADGLGGGAHKGAYGGTFGVADVGCAVW